MGKYGARMGKFRAEMAKFRAEMGKILLGPKCMSNLFWWLSAACLARAILEYQLVELHVPHVNVLVVSRHSLW